MAQSSSWPDFKRRYPNLANIMQFELVNLALKINTKGMIEDVLFQQGVYDYSLQFDFLKNKPVADYFDLPRKKSIKSIALDFEPSLIQEIPISLFNPKCRLASKNLFEHFDMYYGFHSTIPFSNLYLYCLAGYGFLGLVRFGEISKRMVYLQYNPFIFTDQSGTVAGVNNAFIDQFAQKGLGPADFLGKPATHYIDPDPVQTITGNRDAYHKLLNLTWRKAYGVNVENSKTSGYKKYLDPDQLKALGRKWIWEPGTRTDNFLDLKIPVDLTRQDIKIELEFELLEGGLPLALINCAPRSEQFFPDYMGYLLGPDQYGKSFIIKKGGNIVMQSPSPVSGRTGLYTYTVIKRGPHMALFINNSLTIGYTDLDPFESSQAYQYFFSRGKSRVAVKSLRVSQSAILPEDPSYNTVMLRNGTVNGFRANQFLDRITQVLERIYYAFIFYDVTSLKKSIHSLERSQAKTAKERDMYRAIAMEAEREQSILIGKSAVMERLKKDAKIAAASPFTVLIQGETGTGKEVLARFIHENSPYANGPFVKVDCATLPGTLMESELFGFEKGAFTGATHTRMGKLEAAQNGTLFLDEVGNIDPATQAKLLRFLQDFTFERIGSNRRHRVECRIVAATNSPLKQMVDEKRFRADLFYRINTVEFHVPVLKDRRQDIAPLCLHFLNQYAKKLGREIKEISPEAFRKLTAYGWPGNVRELENVIQQSVLFSDTDVLGPDQVNLPAVNESRPAQPASLEIPVGNSRALRREHILALLEQNNNIVLWAARAGKIPEVTFHRKMKKFGIKVKR